MDEAPYQQALEFAQLAHHDQTRLSGEPFVSHPQAVAATLRDWGLDQTAIIAGLLHDTVEDGGATRDDLVKQFGEEVALIVDGVTKITGIHLTGSTEEQFVENLRKMILVMAADLRVVLVKLADRLHNMRTLQYLSPAKQIENARETLEIYAPLAERLGMGKVKGELEDLAFPYVYPDDYRWLKSYSAPYYKTAGKYMEKVRRDVHSAISSAGIKNALVSARSKHMYSLYRKLLRPENNRDITKIHDLMALRILVDTPEQCYIALGIIHKLYRPVPYLGVRDFIANPKPNGYRSIQTNVFGPEGHIAEVQIRTYAMHDQSEMGVAAHWHYSAAKSAGASDEKLEKGHVEVSDKLSWVKQLVSWQNEITDSQEYLTALKFDALQHRNLVFSPVGDVYDLPRGATPIDYAYAVHTKLGHQTGGAKVNGKLVPLNQPLHNGDVVEIIIDRKRTKPSHEWLGFVVTTTARHHISKALKN